MLFFKKLCRFNGMSSTRHGQERDQHNGEPPTAGITLQVVNPLDNSTRQRFATLSSNADDQFIHRTLCRTPPPLYNSLPVTPPPSYTPRRSIEHAADGRRQVPEGLPLDRHVIRAGPGNAGAGVNEAGVERRQLVQCLETAANHRNERIATAQSAQGQHQHQQQQQQQRQQRRRRLQLLQQQRFSHANGTSSDSTSSDSGAELAAVNATRRHRPQRTRGLRDAYCPDLLHACSLILHQQDTSDSSVGSFTDTPPTRSYSSDYVEIDEIQPADRPQRPRCRNHTSFGNCSLLQAISTPELRTPHYHNSSQCLSRSRRDIGTESGANASFGRIVDNQIQRLESRAMGQNLSLRRPRISLTWVLREQQQQQQQQQQPTEEENDDKQTVNPGTEPTQNNNNGYVNGLEGKHRTEVVPTELDTTKKRYRVKQLPGGTDPLNGYATTPTAYTTTAASQKFFSNQNLLDYKDKSRAPSKELLFVCTPQRLPKAYGGDHNEALAMAKKRNEIRKKLAAKLATLQASSRAGDGVEAKKSTTTMNNTITTTTTTTLTAATGGASGVLEKEELKSLKGTYSEPSLVAASEGNHRRHRHRKRRERHRVQKFGYEISNVDEFLSKCSLASPGNIPVVLSTSSTLYQTRPGGYQMEIPLPLGMVVNAVFKNQNWLYVQTPHAEEGYVGYSCCLPLGILPPSARGGSSGSKPTPCWESNGDVFPRPCGNMTDSEKEIRLRGGTRSDGARTPRGKRNETVQNEVDTENGNSQHGEHRVDKLYLRAASQPKLVEKAYAQLKATKTASIRSANDEYVTLQQQQHKSKLHVQKHMQHQHQLQQLQQVHQQQLAKGPFVTNGHNGQHLHPKSTNLHGNPSAGVAKKTAGSTHSGSTVLHSTRKQPGLRQTLVAINTDYATENISVQKGEIVTLCECRESKDHRQWFYVRTRDGREGYIPAEVAGHGYL